VPFGALTDLRFDPCYSIAPTWSRPLSFLAGLVVKGKLRYIAVAVGILVLILIALPFFISVNVFRPALERHLSLALGRKVEVGNLSLAILSGALAAETFSISEDPSFNKSPFLMARSLKVSVELWPLITSKNLKITGVTIENPEVILLRNRQAQWNFSTLATGASPPPTPATSPSGRSAAASGSASPEFTVAKLKLEKGRVTIGSAVADKRNVYDNVDLEATNLSLKSQFPVMLTGNLPGGGHFNAEGSVGPIHQGDSSLSPLDMKVTISGLDLSKQALWTLAQASRASWTSPTHYNPTTDSCAPREA